MSGAVFYESEVRYGSASETGLSSSLPEIGEFEAAFQAGHYCPHFAETMEATQMTVASTADNGELRHEFNRLARKWLEETRYVSSVSDIILHPAYMRIIGMGRQAVPWILDRLTESSELWFWALSYMTGEDPVTEDLRGNVQAMRQAWLDWGRRNGLF